MVAGSGTATLAIAPAPLPAVLAESRRRRRRSALLIRRAQSFTPYYIVGGVDDTIAVIVAGQIDAQHTGRVKLRRIPHEICGQRRQIERTERTREVAPDQECQTSYPPTD